VPKVHALELETFRLLRLCSFFSSAFTLQLNSAIFAVSPKLARDLTQDGRGWKKPRILQPKSEIFVENASLSEEISHGNE